MTETNNKALGYKQETNASSYLEELGYTIIDRNWQFSNRGEIDIIAIDPNRFGKKYLIFVEVKYRDWSLEAALNAVDYRKLSQLKMLAQGYLIKKKLDLNKTHFSFDLIAISRSKLRHVKDII